MWLILAEGLAQIRRTDGSLGAKYSTGKSRTKTIKSLGCLDVLEKEHADPVAHFKKIVEEMKQQGLENNAPSKISIDRNEVITAGQDNRKNLGYSVLSKMYYELGLDVFFNNHSRGLKMEYSVNSIMKLLLFSRILAPSSKKKTFENRDWFFESFESAIP
jgi:uncharacterized protein YidB (DUF937 family)